MLDNVNTNKNNPASNVITREHMLKIQPANITDLFFEKNNISIHAIDAQPKGVKTHIIIAPIPMRSP